MTHVYPLNRRRRTYYPPEVKSAIVRDLETTDVRVVAARYGYSLIQITSLKHNTRKTGAKLKKEKMGRPPKVATPSETVRERVAPVSEDVEKSTMIPRIYYQPSEFISPPSLARLMAGR